MKRRKFITKSVLAFSVGTFGASRSAQALLNCGPVFPNGFQRCEAGIDSSLAHVSAAATGGQHLDQWCWAACIEMVFRYYGFRVPQERIVAETWGEIVNLPGQPGQILRNLNRPWTDNNGDQFGVSGDSFSANPVTAAQDLANDMPLIIGTTGHAMVLTSLVYDRHISSQGNVISAIVRDPWPRRGRRTLSPREWYNTSFLARIRVSSN